MAVSARLEQLSSKHTTLDMQIREKLQIKDTIKSFSKTA